MIPRRVLLSLFLIVFLLTGSTLGYAQQGQEDRQYFDTYGHWVSGEVLAFYKSAADPARLFGEPITSRFDDPIHPGIQIQYFERVRMDYDPAKPAGQRVSLANLGEFVHNDGQPGQPASFPTNTPLCQTFSNGKQVCYAFKQFYDEVDGAKYLGQPLTNAEMLDDRIVQYFDHVRLEWSNNMPVGERVVVSAIGRVDFDKRIGNPIYLEREDGIAALDQVKLNVYVFAARPLIAAGQEQQIFALVYDQRGNPVQGASIVLNVVYPGAASGSQRRPAQPTNEFGFTQDKFTIPDLAPNQEVQVTVEAEKTNIAPVTASTWFRIWW